MFFTNSYETFNGDYRCIHHTQFTVARKKSTSTEQKRYGIGNIRRN